MGITTDQLSRWILGHSLPQDEDIPKLRKLTSKVEELEILMDRDHLDYSRRLSGITPKEFCDHARAIAKYARKVEADELSLRAS